VRRPATARILAAALLLVTACAPAATYPPPPLSPVPEPRPGEPTPGPLAILPNDVHWVRNSAEYRALTKQIYRHAESVLRRHLADHDGSAWGVILDADETVLDNSDYQKWLAETGRSFEASSWNEFVRLGRSREVPGAAAFTRAVRELGGRVAIVTNRDERVCDETRANLSGVHIVWDVVLCMQPGESDKNPRFEAVERGATGALPALRVLLYVGDNIHDFPGLSQRLREAPAAFFDEFGGRFILLPNPMYGSFEGVERH
jgi:5'-nucleotidase (lipoprotein e(P4) family)